MEKEKIRKAGKIAAETIEYAKSIVKKGESLLDIAEKIESKIEELGGKPAFPTTLSIDEVAAHFTPMHNDVGKAYGLIKVDLGVNIDGWISDTAFTIDLEGSEENKKLIETAEEALDKALRTVEEGVSVGEIGKTVQNFVKKKGCLPIANLTGHEIAQYDLHAGVSIPNIDNGSDEEIEQTQYAVEPFVTKGSANGKIQEGKPSGIYVIEDTKMPRSPIAREILEFIENEYKTLPFCSRWLVNKFGTKALVGLKQLEANGNLHHYGQLVETSGNKVAQREHSILINEKGKPEITTET